MKKVMWSASSVMLGAFLSLSASSTPEHRIVPLGLGRLGDQIVAYCKAKYYSMKYDIPLVLPEIEHASNFYFYTQEEHQDKMRFGRRILIKTEADFTQDRRRTLFTVHMFTPLSPEVAFGESDFFTEEIYDKMIQCPDFAAEIRRMLQPVGERILDPIPDNVISVAVHIRKGSGGDQPLHSKQMYTSDDTEHACTGVSVHSSQAADVGFPLKFPPEQYYIDQINELAQMLPNHVLYIRVFSDDPAPHELMARLKAHCMYDNCIFLFSNPGAWRDKIIDDLFAMTTCDCLIRSCSHFAGMAQIIGEHKLIISPASFVWKDQYLVIPNIAVTTYDRTTRQAQREIHASLRDADGKRIRQCLGDQD